MKYLNSSLNESLIKKWSPLLNIGGRISSPAIKSNLARVLENTRSELTRSSGSLMFEHTGSPSAYGMASGPDNAGMGLPKLVLPVLRRIFPDLMAHELVGVQAMNGPIGFVLALRARLNGGNGWVGTGGNPSVNEIGFGPIDSSYTGTFDGDTRFDETYQGTFPNAYDNSQIPGTRHGMIASNNGGPGVAAPQFYGAKGVDGSGNPISAWPQNAVGETKGDDSRNYKDEFNSRTSATAHPTGGSADPYSAPGIISAGTEVSARYSETQSGTGNEDMFAYPGQNPPPFNPTNRTLGVGAPNTPAVQFADIIHGTFPTVNFGLERKEVVAKTRKLGAHWSPELAEDMEVMNNIDVETELVNMLSYEIGAEIDRQVLTEMIKLSTVNGIETINAESINGWDQASRVIALLSKVNYIANQIAINTRRGSGNFVIASPKICSLLTMLGVSKYTAAGETMPSVPASAVGALQKVGLINDGQQLLVRDTFATVDYFLVGYKGTHPADSGIIYAPYIPVQLSKVMRPDTFTPQIGARTRYGLVANPLDGAAYYKLTIVANADSMFMGAQFPNPVQD